MAAGKKFRKKTSSSAKPHKKKTAAATGRAKRSGGGKSKSNSPVQLDVVRMEAQRQAVIAEMTLTPPPNFAKRVKCSVGKHGETARRLYFYWLNENGDPIKRLGGAHKYFCVSCGREWTKVIY